MSLNRLYTVPILGRELTRAAPVMWSGPPRISGADMPAIIRRSVFSICSLWWCVVLAPLGRKGPVVMNSKRATRLLAAKSDDGYDGKRRYHLDFRWGLGRRMFCARP
jgi:hypothetical protein